MNLIFLILSSAINAGTPILFAALGEIITERSGVLNLGIEGMMLLSAFTGFYVDYLTGDLFLAVIAGMAVSAGLAMLHAFLTVILRANQIVSGLSITILGTSLASFLGDSLIGQPVENVFKKMDIPLLCKIPCLSAFFSQNLLVYISYFLVLFIGIFIYKTRTGLHLKVVGESPKTADSMGISVVWYRFLATVIGGAICGLSGIYLSLFDTPSWMDKMSGGRGWLAIAIVIFSRWNPFLALIGAYLFGGLVAMQFRAQAFGFNFNIYLLEMIPYIATILTLVIFSGLFTKKRKDYASISSLGVPYDRESKI